MRPGVDHVERRQRRHEPAPHRPRIGPAQHPQLVASVQIGAGRLPIRHAARRAQASDAAQRRLRTRPAGDAHDALLRQLASTGNGPMAGHVRHRGRLRSLALHHAQLVPAVYADRSNR